MEMGWRCCWVWWVVDGWMVVMMGVGEGEEAMERIDGWEDGWMDEYENGLIGLGGS